MLDWVLNKPLRYALILVHVLEANLGFQPLTIITKRSNLNVAAALDPPLCFTQC